MNTTLELSDINRRIGQLFMAGMPGPHLDKETEALIRDYNIGGIILFSRNIEDPVQVAILCRDIQDASVKYHGFPIFLAIDQEGGRVARLKEPFTQFPGNAAIGMDELPEAKAIEFGRITAKEMKLVGLNMDLAPVVDVRRGEPGKHLKDRIFGEDPDKTAQLGRTVVKTLQENGVMAVAKHFPGLGRADLDPHLDLPRIELSKKDIEEVNLPPFKAVIDEKVTGIMTSHAIYPALDPDLPGTLSPKVLNGLLREKMGHKGLIITDDLEMGAIASQWGVAEGALAAFEAGADLLLICENQENLLKSINLIRTKLLKDEIPFQQLIDSNKRVVKARSKFIGRKDEIALEKVREYFKSRT